MNKTEFDKHWQSEIDHKDCPKCGYPQTLINRYQIEKYGANITVSEWTCYECKKDGSDLLRG